MSSSELSIIKSHDMVFFEGSYTYIFFQALRKYGKIFKNNSLTLLCIPWLTVVAYQLYIP